MSKVIITIDIDGEQPTRHVGKVTEEHAKLLIDMLNTCYNSTKLSELIAKYKATGKKE